MVEDLLVSAVAELNEDIVIKLVKKELRNKKDPKDVLARIRLGMEIVGERYKEGKYFISDLIMSGLIFTEVLNYIDFPNESTSQFSNIVMLFATVEQDIHDVGKNITISFYKSRGIKVIDLGVNVPPEKIVEEIIHNNANVLSLSGLITESYDSMKKTIELLEEKKLRDKVKVIIGGNVNEEVRKYVAADFWTPDFTNGLEICQKIAAEL
ncbi:MAG: cobalamin-dependent protein [Bacillota bacterium]